MRWIQLLIFLLCVGISASAFPEFYQYVDENGVIRFTDSYVDVPVKQRNTVRRFTESREQPASGQIIEKEQPRQRPETEAVANLGPKERQGQRESLNQKKIELDRKTAELTKERAALEKEKETVSMSDFAQAKAYRKKVIDFNQRLSQHQQQLKDFNSHVETFNAEARAAEK